MKKFSLFVLVLGFLLLSNTAFVFANENDSIYNAEIKAKEITIGEFQEVYLDFQVESRDIDFYNSYIEVFSSGNSRTIKGIINNNGNIYFKFYIDEFYATSTDWLIKINVLEKDGGDRVEEKSLPFRVIRDSRGYSADEYNEAVNLSETEQTDLKYENQSSLLSNIKVEDSNGYYTISGVVSSDIKKISCPTWTARDGQDDIVWKSVPISQGAFSFIVDMKDHLYETGDYITHVYLYDSLGHLTVKEVIHELKYSAPVISNTQIIEENGKFSIYGNVEGYDISSVIVPTWSDEQGQDDITWESAALNGNAFHYCVDMKDHLNETGKYTSHIYAYDALGNLSVASVDGNIKYSLPMIDHVEIIGDNGKYTVTGNVTGYDSSSVLLPTWTSKNGQDDIKWYNASINDGKFSYVVDMKDHNYETGNYYTHMYLYDGIGNMSFAETNYNLNYANPSVSNVQVIGGNGCFSIMGDTEGYGITLVQLPTWTYKNGQDDIVWHSANLENHKFSYTVNIEDHNYEEDLYITHIYVYDSVGNYTVTSLNHIMNYALPVFKNINVQENAGKYTVSGEVSGHNITSIKMPTWTDSNGQDDIVWYNAVLKDNKFSYTIDMKDHNFETGFYRTHVYAYDSIGNFTIYDIHQYIENQPPVISDIAISDVSSQGYLITCYVTDDYGIDQVLFPTWSMFNGQDDITWQKGNIRGNSVSYRVYVKDHKYNFGNYITHIYAYDKAGLLTAVEVPTISIDEFNVPGWKIINGQKYLYDANGNIVGNGMMVIDISEHNGDINWTSVKNSGVDGIILRSSYGAADDFSQMDKKFKKNITELNRLGIPYGIYHFSYATTVEHGAEEATYLLKCLKEADASPKLPIFYDLEYSTYVGNKDSSFYTEIAKSFSSVIKGAGYQVGVYANYNWWTNILTDSSFNNYMKWVAHYGTNANNEAATANPYWHPSGEYKIWQYSSCGKVNGINTKVDMNIMY